MSRPFLLNEDKTEARLEARGLSALLDSELLALAAGVPVGSPDLDGLLSHFGSLYAPELLNADPNSLERFLSNPRAVRLAAVFQVAKRIEASKATLAEKLDAPQKVFDFVRPRFPHDREACVVLCLNRRNRLLRAVEISVGTATSALMHPREVFKAALTSSASAVIVCHNHPSGDPTPSPADRSVTKQINEAGRVVGVELLDHVIIGTPEADPAGKGWFSFGESGLI
jgi:DNA repair protein RadC